MITASGLGMHFGGQTLFTGADLQLDRGHRYGIVGANGAGKSTLLRILAGQEAGAAGAVVRQRSARLGVLEQDQFQFDAERILDVVMQGNAALWAAMQEKELLLAAAADPGGADRFDADRYAALEDVVMRFDGYGVEARAGRILEGLGVPTRVHDQPLRVLSGGFKLRVLLARTLAAEPDLLFLDEPTNHLDILAIRWLEEFLQTFTGCAVVVSHDLRFLDAVCTDILDVDYERVTAYRGNYTTFVARKAEERRRMEAEIDRREKEIAEHRDFVARFAAKATKARQANSQKKQLERVVIEALPRSSRRHPKFRFVQRRPSGREVLRLRGVARSFGDKQVLTDVEVTVERGDRVAFIGPNGIGKSTLLKIAVGALAPDAGEVAWGHEAHVGYFPQDHHEALGSPTQTVLSCLWDVCPDDGIGSVLSRLGAVLFSREDADKAVGNLSGGEGARLLFARLAAEQPSVLVLDEPTNHLDLEGIEALADALAAYDGTLLFVSHDRWFVDRLATRIVDLRPDGLRDYRGSYEEYLRWSSDVDHLDRDQVVAADRRSGRARRERR